MCLEDSGIKVLGIVRMGVGWGRGSVVCKDICLGLVFLCKGELRLV